MDPLRLIETTPGHHSLLLTAGSTEVDLLVEECGHLANGYFWEGVARWLIRTDQPDLGGRLDFDPEAGMFCAYGEDRDALTVLGSLISSVANDAERMRQLIDAAHTAGFDFDD